MSDFDLTLEDMDSIVVDYVNASERSRNQYGALLRNPVARRAFAQQLLDNTMRNYTERQHANIAERSRARVDSPPQLSDRGLLLTDGKLRKRGADLNIPLTNSKYVDEKDPVSLDAFQPGDRIVEIFQQGKPFYMLRDSLNQHIDFANSRGNDIRLPQTNLPLHGSYAREFTQASISPNYKELSKLLRSTKRHVQRYRSHFLTPKVPSPKIPKVSPMRQRSKGRGSSRKSSADRLQTLRNAAKSPTYYSDLYKAAGDYRRLTQKEMSGFRAEKFSKN